MALSGGEVIRFGLVSHMDTGALIVNNLHYRLEGDTAFIGNEPTIADCASEVWTKLGTAYRALLNTAYTVDLVHGYEEVETWNGAVAGVGDFTVNAAGTATGTGTSEPRPLAAVIDLKSDVGSRSARGWILVPAPLAQSMWSASGNIAGAALTALQTFAALLDDTIQHDVIGVHAWHLKPVIYSRTRRKRGDSPWYFDVKAAVAKSDPRWVARRRSIP